MSFTPGFSCSQLAGLPSTLNIVDTSIGSDPDIASRRVYLTDYLGNYVVDVSNTTTNYTEWPYAESSIAIDCLQQDMALNVTVLWLDAGNVTLYEKTDMTGCTLYNETFYYALTQAQATQNSPITILQDTLYYTNKMKLRLAIDSGNQAVTLGYDIASAQQCYNQATYMVTNQNLFF